MAMKNLFVELAIKSATEGGQRNLVDYISEDAPILGALPISATNAGLSATYEVLTDVDSVPLQELDAPLTSVDAASRIEQVQLKNWAAKMVVGEDKLMTLGYGKDAASYFMDRAEAVFRATGGRIDKTIYDSLKAYAVANYATDSSRVINCSGNNNTNYSIVAVKWVTSDISGLYNPAGWGNGKVFDIEKLNGGNLYEDSNGVAVYGTRVKLNLGLKLANPRFVTSIVNIDKGADLGTLTLDVKLSQLIEECRGADAIYMHPTLKRMIGSEFKGAFVQMPMNSTEINYMVDTWDGVPIITSYNLSKGAESNVTL